MYGETRAVQEFTDGIDGWLTLDEGRFLYWTATRCPGKGVIVEIGSYKGKSTIWIANGSKKGNKVAVYAIDPHTGSSDCQKTNSQGVWTFAEFEKNMREARVEDIVVPVVRTSEEASQGWNKPIEFLFIDGEHQYEFVRKDFVLWFPHLVEGGTIALHDTTACVKALLGGFVGPQRVAQEFMFRSRQLKDVGLVDTITYGVKCEENRLKDRIRTRCVRFHKLFPDLQGMVVRRLPGRVKATGRAVITRTFVRGAWVQHGGSGSRSRLS